MLNKRFYNLTYGQYASKVVFWAILKNLSSLFLLIAGRTQNPSKSLKKTPLLRQKGDNNPTPNTTLSLFNLQVIVNHWMLREKFVTFPLLNNSNNCNWVKEDVFVTEDEQVLTVQREKREAGDRPLKKRKG